MYQVGDSVILSESMLRFFNETGPHLIIGRKGNQYLIAGKNGWSLGKADKEEYQVDDRYLRQPVWVIDINNIVDIAKKELSGTRCKSCGAACAWTILDAYHQFTCASCKKAGKVVMAKIMLN